MPIGRAATAARDGGYLVIAPIVALITSLRAVLALRFALLSLDLARCSVAKPLHDKIEVVLLLALLVRSIVGPYPGFDEQLVALACAAHQRLG
jgi:hypothetical protein